MLLYSRSSGRVLAGLVTLVMLALGGCRASTAGPEISRVRPESTEPGGLVLVSGRNFRDGDVVVIGGRPVADVTWVNAQLLTATLPPAFPEGAHALEVRSVDGQRAATTLSVRAPAPAPTSAPVIPAPREPTPQPAPEVRPQATPSPAAAPAGTAEERKKAEERLREEQKREEERRREEQKQEKEREREEEKKREN